MAIMTSPIAHVPVLLEEALHHLAVKQGGRYIDATTGLGGHSSRIAEAMGPEGMLLCVDRDAEALESAQVRLRSFGRRISFACGDFRDIGTMAQEAGFERVDGILFDLGVSSLQLGRADRGFSFALEGPLDMRMGPQFGGETAAEIVNTWDETALANLIYRYGEETRSRRIAAAIVRDRPFQTTWDLARSVEQAVGRAGGQTRIHPATRVFLALRIRVNGELDSLDEGLPLACDLLDPGTDSDGGRLVVISFHSLEDRLVKQFLRRESTGCVYPPAVPVCVCGHVARLRLLTKRGIRPSEDEVARNPRARSATLRAAVRIGGVNGGD